MATFVDRVTVHTQGGNGGPGCASVHREKFKPLGGPDGGKGGDGGSVIVRVDPQTTTLLDYHHSPHRSAGSGTHGMGDYRSGSTGADLVLSVPDGTVVRNGEGDILADLVGAGAEVVVAAGGRGGLGNWALASARRKAPGFALLGEPGEEQDIVLELKSIADVALVGFPSAGKSSLVASISAARPKIADYPFTTLVPNLGVVQAGDNRFTVADVPGLIPGASEGKGLGLEFLRHIERCAVIVHILDCATLEPDRDPISDLDALEIELGAYASALDAENAADAERADGGTGIEGGRVPLMERPRVVVLNKIDVPDARELAEFVREDLEARGLRVFEISTASHEGLRALSFALSEIVMAARAAAPAVAPARIVLRPKAVDDAGFTVTEKRDADGTYFEVRGVKPERWVRQTDFSNDEAVGYLADRLARLGVEDKLFKTGAVAGDEVRIGGANNAVIFDWEPTLLTGSELLGGPRGSDLRLEENLRASRKEKRRDHHERMDAKAEARAELWHEREAGHWADPSAEGAEDAAPAQESDTADDRA